METYCHKLNRQVVIAQPHDSGLGPWSQRVAIIRDAIHQHSLTRLQTALEIPEHCRGELNIADVAKSMMPTYLAAKASLERLLPASMLRGLELGVSHIRASGGGSYDPGDTKVNSRIGCEVTLLHELTHALEYRIEGLSEWTRAYILNRSQGKRLRNHGLRYQAGAKYYLGEWPDAYAGRIYKTVATEILTVGIKQLVTDPLTLAEKDPEYFWWLVQTFQHFGDIRDPEQTKEHLFVIEGAGDKFTSTYRAPLSRIKWLKALIDCGKSPDVTDLHGTPLLLTAATGGDLWLAEQLIRHDAQIDQTDGVGNTALMCGVIAGNLAIVRLLLSKGANVNNLDHSGKSALYQACSHHHDEIVKVLLAAGADPNLTQNDYFPLAVAAGSEDSQIIKLLVKHGANLNPEVANPLSLPLSSTNLRINKLLIKHGADINMRSKSGRTLLLEQSHYFGSIKVMEHLLNLNADVNCSDDEGDTPFLRVFKSARYRPESKSLIPKAKLLLSKGADVNHQDNKGRTALMYASSFGIKGLVEYLIENGANSRIRRPDGMNAQLDALLYKFYEIAEYLSAASSELAGRNGDHSVKLDPIFTVLKPRPHPDLAHMPDS